MTPARTSDATRLRVGLFHADLPESGRKPGGVAVAVHRLAAALTARPDAEVTVYSLTAAPPGAPYRHIRIPSCDRSGVPPRLLRLTAVPLALNFVRFDQDVLHLHGDDWFYFRRTLPTVRTMHGSALHEARTATSVKRRWSQRLTYLLERRAARGATVCTAVGPETLALYGGAYLVDNGVDACMFEAGQKAVRPRVLFVGTWAGRKRGWLVHEAFRQHVLPRVPDAELYMVCDRCPPAPGVVHVEAPDDRTLADLFRSAWVLAFPSTYEGFGIPYVEALASGTAVVTTPNSGAAYVLDGGRLGVVVDDPEFGPAVARLLTDERERGRLATAGRRAAERFTWDRVAAAHLEIYRTAVAAWRG